MDERDILIKIDGFDDQEGQVPLLLLSDIFRGVQQTIYYIAMAELQWDIKKRARVPAEIKKACELRRTFERPGSYQLVARVAEPKERQMSIFEEIEDIGLYSCQKFITLVSKLSKAEHLREIQKLIQDSYYLKLILFTIKEYCPKEDENWSLSFEDFKHVRYGLNADSRLNISKLLVQPQIEQLTVSGELIRLHVDERKFSIYHTPTKRVLDCYYEPEIEDFIIQSIKDFIVVKGTVQLDEKGKPRKIVSVSEISELDQRPLKLNQVTSGSLTLLFNQPLEVPLSFNLEEEQFEFEIPSLNIFASSSSRKEALRVIEEDIVWLWREYVEKTGESLSADAEKLRERLKVLVKEVKSGV